MLSSLPSELVAAATRRELGRGEFLFRAGDRARWVFAVEKGRVRLERPLADGFVLTLHTARRGESFAEAALFGERYHCDAVAETGSRVVAVDREAALAVLTAEPGTALELARRLAEQVRGLRALLEIRNVRSAEERVVRYLQLQPLFGEPPDERPLRALAAEIGLREETLYRTVRRLEEAGTLRRDGRWIELAEG